MTPSFLPHTAMSFFRRLPAAAVAAALLTGLPVNSSPTWQKITFSGGGSSSGGVPNQVCYDTVTAQSTISSTVTSGLLTSPVTITYVMIGGGGGGGGSYSSAPTLAPGLAGTVSAGNFSVSPGDSLSFIVGGGGGGSNGGGWSWW